MQSSKHAQQEPYSHCTVQRNWKNNSCHPYNYPPKEWDLRTTQGAKTCRRGINSTSHVASCLLSACFAHHRQTPLLDISVRGGLTAILPVARAPIVISPFQHR